MIRGRAGCIWHDSRVDCLDKQIVAPAGGAEENLRPLLAGGGGAIDGVIQQVGKDAAQVQRLHRQVRGKLQGHPESDAPMPAGLYLLLQHRIDNRNGAIGGAARGGDVLLQQRDHSPDILRLPCLNQPADSREMVVEVVADTGQFLLPLLHGAVVGLLQFDGVVQLPHLFLQDARFLQRDDVVQQDYCGSAPEAGAEKPDPGIKIHKMARHHPPQAAWKKKDRQINKGKPPGGEGAGKNDDDAVEDDTAPLAQRTIEQDLGQGHPGKKSVRVSRYIHREEQLDGKRLPQHLGAIEQGVDHQPLPHRSAENTQRGHDQHDGERRQPDPVACRGEHPPVYLDQARRNHEYQDGADPPGPSPPEGDHTGHEGVKNDHCQDGQKQQLKKQGRHGRTSLKSLAHEPEIGISGLGVPGPAHRDQSAAFQQNVRLLETADMAHVHGKALVTAEKVRRQGALQGLQLPVDREHFLEGMDDDAVTVALQKEDLPERDVQYAAPAAHHQGGLLLEEEAVRDLLQVGFQQRLVHGLGQIAAEIGPLEKNPLGEALVVAGDVDHPGPGGEALQLLRRVDPCGMAGPVNIHQHSVVLLPALYGAEEIIQVGKAADRPGTGRQPQLAVQLDQRALVVVAYCDLHPIPSSHFISSISETGSFCKETSGGYDRLRRFFDQFCRSPPQGRADVVKYALQNNFEKGAGEALCCCTEVPRGGAMKKRFLSGLLALVMVLAMLPGEALAYKTHPVVAGVDQRVSLGAFATGVIGGDGGLYLCGQNIGTGLERYVPGESFRSVAAAKAGGAAITTGGRVYAWGPGEYLGAGLNTFDWTGPTLVPMPEPVASVAVSSGSFPPTFAAITESGALYIWGSTSYGLNGTTDTFRINAPQRLMPDKTFKAVCIADNHAAAVTTGGQLYTWGTNQYGQLGNGNIDTSNSNITMPTLITVPDTTFSSVILADNRSAAITTTGELYMWGNNSGGAAGVDSSENKISFPTKIMDDVIAVEMTTLNNLALKLDGTAWVWGAYNKGLLGGLSYTTSDQKTPAQLRVRAGTFNLPTPLENVVDIAMGDDSAAAITADGTLYGWGRIPGTGKEGGNSSPEVVMPDTSFANVFAGAKHMAALTAEGELYTWGVGSEGELGTGATGTIKELVPVRVLYAGLGPDVPGPGPDVPGPGPVTSDEVKLVSVSPGRDGEAYFFRDNYLELKLIFDHEIEGFDFSKGTLVIREYDTGEPVYWVKQNSYLQDNKTPNGDVRLSYPTTHTLTITALSTAKELKSGGRYYVTIDEGFLSFKGTDKSFSMTGIDDWQFQFYRGRMPEFTYKSSDGVTRTSTLEYDDRWFDESAYEFQPKLAIASLSLAMSAFSANPAGQNYEKSADNVKKLMGDLGYSDIDIEVNDDYTREPGYDTMGVAIGSKFINYGMGATPVVVVALRGGGYEAEWGGNVTVGADGYHKGFKAASDEVIRFLKEYLAKHGLDTDTDLRIWMTGYSRSAATANITACRLDDGVAGIPVSKGHLYTYCFATPKGVETSRAQNTAYENIFNIINPSDMVPMVAMSGWGFDRAGINIFLPSWSNYSYPKWQAALEDTIKQYHMLTGARFLEKVGQEAGLKQATDSLAAFLKSRYTYSVACEPELRSTVGNLMKKSAPLGEDAADYAISYLFGKVEGIINGVGMVIENPVSSMTIGGWILYNSWDAYQLIDYKGCIGPAHYPEYYLAWLRALNADGKLDVSNSNCRYRYLTADCPVDISVLDDSGQIVAQFTNGTASENPLGLNAYTDTRGSMVIELPLDETYTIQFAGTGEGELYYNIYEVDRNLGQVDRQVSYQALPLVTGTTYTGQIKQIPDSGTSAQAADTYPLYIGELNGESIPVTKDLTGEDIVAAQVHTVELQAEGSGAVSGAGLYADGSFARVTALAQSGASFLGWYDGDGNLVSNEIDYRFPVTREISLTGRFSTAPVYPGDIYPPAPVVPGISSSSTPVSTEPDTPAAQDTPETTQSPATMPFTDVAVSSWYYEAVKYVYEKGMMNGTAANLFSPNAATTRGMIVTILYRLEGEPAAGGPAFTDVPAGQWYTSAVGWAAANGIVDGYGNGRFGPNDIITREQLAAILYRYTAFKGGDTSARADTGAYRDGAEISSYALDAISWAVAAGVINGVGDGRLAPKESASRAQVAQMLMNYWNR